VFYIKAAQRDHFNLCSLLRLRAFARHFSLAPRGGDKPSQIHHRYLLPGSAPRRGSRAMCFPQQGGGVVPLPNGRRAVAPRLEAGWAGATVMCLNAASEGESLCLFPLFVPATAAIPGWPAFHRDSGSQQPARLMGHGRVGSTAVSGERETSSGSGELKPHNKQRAISLWLKRLGRGPGSKPLGWVEQGQAALGPESEQPSRHTWAGEMTESCNGAE